MNAINYTNNDKINNDEFNNLNLEETIYYKKIKSKAKTIYVGEYDNLNPIEVNSKKTIYIGKIIINYSNNESYNLIYNKLLNASLVISNSSDINLLNLYILCLPIYLCEIKKISSNQLELNINFNNFFPWNIPIVNNSLYFIIKFENIIENNLITKINLAYKLYNLEIEKDNMFENDYIPIQLVQTFNIKCKNKIIDKIIKKKILFNNMCRAFWIKMNLIDYNNLDELIMEFNGHNRFELKKYQIELICEKKILHNDYIILFLNLEFNNNDWYLPKNKLEISKIYSNSCNMSRIDTNRLYLKFTNNYINDDIKITSLNLNLLSIYNNGLQFNLYNYF